MLGLVLAAVGGVSAKLTGAAVTHWSKKRDAEQAEEKEVDRERVTVEKEYIAAIRQLIKDLQTELRDARVEYDKVISEARKLREDMLDMATRQRVELDALERRCEDAEFKYEQLRVRIEGE